MLSLCGLHKTLNLLPFLSRVEKHVHNVKSVQNFFFFFWGGGGLGAHYICSSFVKLFTTEMLPRVCCQILPMCQLTMYVSPPYSLIASDVTVAMVNGKKATFFCYFGTNVVVLSHECNKRI